MAQPKIPLKTIVDYFFIGLLGVLILGYSAFMASFAEHAIYLPFLSFPIFIGEIVLGICLVWMFYRIFTQPASVKIFPDKYMYLIIFFSMWILIKTYLGYHQYGPLSFRNAALFYYSWFALISYYLVSGKSMTEPAKIVLFFFMVALVALNFVGGYCLWFYLAMLMTIGAHIKNIKVRYGAGMVVLLLVLFKFPDFFMGSRSHLVSMLAAILFFFLAAVLSYWKILSLAKKVVLCLAISVGLAVGLIRFADKNEIISLVTPNELFKLYEERIVFIKVHEADFDPPVLTTQLYNPNVPSPPPEDVTSEPSGPGKKAPSKVTAPGDQETPPAETSPPAPALRPLDNAYGNAIFRLLVWRDMVIEMAQEKAIWGISFGKPQRSRSLEICNWADTEWKRDGWITPHNSFLHMTYRGGIIGLLFFIGTIAVIVKLTAHYIAARSLPGLLLVSALVYWIVLSQFLVILELPYMAIPFWCLMGVTLAYAHQLKAKNFRENTPHS